MMKFENCQSGQVVSIRGKMGRVIFPCHDTYTGTKPKIRVMLDEMAPRVRQGFNGENFDPEEVLLAE